MYCLGISLVSPWYVFGMVLVCFCYVFVCVCYCVFTCSCCVYVVAHVFYNDCYAFLMYVFNACCVFLYCMLFVLVCVCNDS